MSYHCWTTDGFGICVDCIRTDKERLLRLIHEAPKFENEFIEWAESSNGEGESIEEADLNELLEYEGDYGNVGLAAIMQKVIEEREKIYLTVAIDFDGEYFLIFEPFYPWNLCTDEERCLTQGGLEEIFNKYIKILTDKPVPAWYQSVENGG